MSVLKIPKRVLGDSDFNLLSLLALGRVDAAVDAALPLPQWLASWPSDANTDVCEREKLYRGRINAAISARC